MAISDNLSAVSVEVTFGNRRGLDKVLSLVLQRCRPVGQQARSMQPDGHLGQFVLYLLEVYEGRFEACPGLRIAYSRLVSCLGDAYSLGGYVYSSRS